MFDMFGGYSESKLKPQLKMAVSRFQIASNKKSALLKQNMREVAVLLAEDPPKEEKARIKAEALIRDDYMIEAYDILSLNCELLSERIKLISFSKECPPDLVSCVSTLIYASPRVDIPELIAIRKQFRAKFGKKFEENALNNVGGVLNERVVTKLSVEPPAAFLVQTYLETICEKYEVSWSPTFKLSAATMGEPMQPPNGYSVQIAQGTGLGNVVATTGQSILGGHGNNNNNNKYEHENEQDYLVSPMSQPTAPMPFVPPPAAPGTKNSAPNKTINDFDEPDIYIPAAPPTASSSSNQSNISSVTGKTKDSGIPPPPPETAPTVQPLVSPSAPSASMFSTKNDDDDDNDNDEDDDFGNSPLPPPAPGTGGSGAGAGAGAGAVQSASYRDLAARFENLKHL